MEKNNRNKQKIDRRKGSRLNVLHLSLPVDIKINNSQQIFPGVLLDISPNSVGLLSFKEIKPDTTLNLSLNLHNIKTGLIKAKVIWVKEVRETYRLGVEFIEISEEDSQKIGHFIDIRSKEDLI